MPSHAARLLLLVAAISILPACRNFSRTTAPGPGAASSASAVEPLAPSPRLIIGRIIAVDARQKFAFVEIAADAPAGSLGDGAELVARTAEFRETARLRASRYLRSRTLGTRIVAGQPSPGDEVVWLAP